MKESYHNYIKYYTDNTHNTRPTINKYKWCKDSIGYEIMIWKEEENDGWSSVNERIVLIKKEY